MSGAKTVEVKIGRVRGALFEATNEDGQTCMIDGPPDLGGQGEGVRPMQMVLMGLAGCSALDVIHILEKQQREPLGDLVVTVKGTRADAIPAVYTDIALHFEASGAIDPHKFERAVKLSMEKYCSVAKMLEKSATITFTTAIRA
ncbi:MAG: OsmC family protein [Polyangiales bacterium]